jgi:hypothetical protein
MIPVTSPLLHFYDDSDYMTRVTAGVRTVNRSLGMKSTYLVPVDTLPGFLEALDKLVQDGKQYSRCLIETHGTSGTFYFGDDYVNGSIIRNWFTNRGFEKIFPFIGSRIYLNGCNIADNPLGWDLLDAMGSVFLKLGGGEVFAQTDVGRPVIYTGTVHHWFDETYYSRWLPGGVFEGHYIE